MENLQPYYDIVEKFIANLGVDPAGCRGDKPGQWNLVKGSAPVWIDIFYLENEKRSYFQVMSPICYIPDSNQAMFMQELLETNHQLFGVAFTKYRDVIYIKMIREVRGLDSDEASDMIFRIGNYADHYDDQLIQKYGAKRTS